MSTVGNNKSAVYRYVENKLKEDMISDQLTIKEYKYPFKGGKQQKRKSCGVKSSNETALAVACNKAYMKRGFLF